MGKKKSAKKKTVATLRHEDASRKNIPTAEYESVMRQEEKSAVQVAYERRNRDLDPQLVWRGKDEQDWSDLVVHAPPLYIQEKVQPKVLVDDLLRRTKLSEKSADPQMDLFADFNGLPEEAKSTEFYQHDANWTNRLILGDSLQAMASLAEREGLRGQVQCIYFDPPYGIKFNSNFQWSTTTRDVKDGKSEHITREPEQVKAFRDTWRDGINSYLTYLRDRLTAARDLLSDSGSIFVQIGDENLHLVKALLDEVFGATNSVAVIPFTKGAAGLSASNRISSRLDYILWYGKNGDTTKYRQLFLDKGDPIQAGNSWVEMPDGARRRLTREERAGTTSLPEGSRLFGDVDLTKPGPGAKYTVEFQGQGFDSGRRWWGMPQESLERAIRADKIIHVGKKLRVVRYADDFSVQQLDNLWMGLGGQKNPVYVVQTNVEVVKRCILMTTDPGDIVLDPTCGSGTTAYVAEQWGRRWITMDTSRVSLALSRARVMAALR